MLSLQGVHKPREGLSSSALSKYGHQVLSAPHHKAPRSPRQASNAPMLLLNICAFGPLQPKRPQVKRSSSKAWQVAPMLLGQSVLPPNA